MPRTSLLQPMNSELRQEMRWIHHMPITTKQESTGWKHKAVFSHGKKRYCGTLSISLLWPLSRVGVEIESSAVGRGPFTQSRFSLSHEPNYGRASCRKLCSYPLFLLSAGVSVPKNQNRFIPSIIGHRLFTLLMTSEENLWQLIQMEAIPQMQGWRWRATLCENTV